MKITINYNHKLWPVSFHTSMINILAVENKIFLPISLRCYYSPMSVYVCFQFLIFFIEPSWFCVCQLCLFWWQKSSERLMKCCHHHKSRNQNHSCNLNVVCVRVCVYTNIIFSLVCVEETQLKREGKREIRESQQDLLFLNVLDISRHSWVDGSEQAGIWTDIWFCLESVSALRFTSSLHPTAQRSHSPLNSNPHPTPPNPSLVTPESLTVQSPVANQVQSSAYV